MNELGPSLDIHTTGGDRIGLVLANGSELAPALLGLEQRTFCVPLTVIGAQTELQTIYKPPMSR